MATRSLIDKIEALPAEKRAEVEEFVDGLGTSPVVRQGAGLRELIRQIHAGREQLYREHGLFDTLPLIREFRETGR